MVASFGYRVAHATRTGSSTRLKVWKNVTFPTAIAVEMMSKTYGRHQTIHPTLKQKINDIWNLPGVCRVIIGPSRGIRHNRPVGSVKLQANADHAVRLVGFSDRGVSEFSVVCNNLADVRQQIINLFRLDVDE
jgi:hypothetical protein